MSLYDILACPMCKVHVIHEGDWLKCKQCGVSYPIVNQIPIMFPNGSIPENKYETDLVLRKSYDPWVHRVILQSLLDDQVVIEIGAGNMALDDPVIIRMDVNLSPYVDLVADAHYLPFLPESVDYIFSLAVFEHLRNPFQVAESIYHTLKDGGYVYHECNWVFSYHGYPNHYFNASLQGMQQIFSKFVLLKNGVATYQMPSFSLQMVLQSYLKYSHADEFEHGKDLTSVIRQILARNLMEYDFYFTEEEALNVAAGTYYAGMKSETPGASVVPQIFHHLWNTQKEIKNNFPDINQLTTIDNILVWARKEGQEQFPGIAEYLENIKPFNKHGMEAIWDRSKIHSMPFIEPRYSAMGFDPDIPMGTYAKNLKDRNQKQIAKSVRSRTNIIQRGLNIIRQEGLWVLILKCREQIFSRYTK